MTIADFSHRIELHFWDWAIPTLSASPFLKSSVKISYRFFRKTTVLQRWLIGSGLSLIGFLNGLLLYGWLAR